MTRILILCLLGCLACDAPTDPPRSALRATMTGLAWLDGPIADAAVEVYAMTDGEPTRLAFNGTTDADGRFAIEMGPANGDLLVRVLAPGGVVEAGVFALPLNGMVDVRITPITHLTTTYTRWRMHALSEPSVDAALNARRLMHAHFGGLDHGRLDPISFTTGPDALDDRALAGLMLDGLRWQARMLAEAAGLSPDGRVTTLSLTHALASDLDDGIFDGRTSAGPLELAGHALTADTLRADYALALARFLQSDTNASRFTPDDLRDRLDAIEQATGPLFPPEVPAGRLDIEPPDVTITPAGGIARGELHIEAVAVDASPIASMRFTAAPLEGTEAVIEGTRATLDVIVDTIQMADGPWGVTVEATDARGNTVRQAVTFTIANTGPIITIATPEPDAVVRDVLTIEARADDPDDVTALALVEPAGLTDLDLTHDGLRVELDTALYPDGPLAFALLARDAAGNETRVERALVIDNNPIGHLAGVAALGTPILGAVVEAWALAPNGTPTHRVDLCDDPCRTDEDGRWAIPVTDGYTGPIRVLLRSNPLMQASHLDAYTGDVILWPEAFTLSLFVPYTAGEARDDLAVHAITTLADATATVYVARGEELLDAHAIATELWSGHACDRCRIGSTPTLDLSTAGGHAALDGPMQLGLFHAGLSALAFEMAGGAAPIYGHGLVTALIEDLSDGLLDGMDVEGRALEASPGARLDAWTLREHLALAIDAAVRGPRNVTRVTPEVLIGPNRLLDAIAMRTGPLWPMDAAPRPYDHDPPTVRITGPAPDTRHGPRTFRLTAVATDPGGIDGIQVIAPDGVAVDVLRETPDDYIAIVDASRHPEGPLTLGVEATDRARNVGRAELPILVDHTPPTVELHHLDGRPLDTDPEDPHFIAARAFSIVATVDEPTTDVVASERTSVQPLGDGRFLLGLRDYQPGQSRIDIIAIDAAGNEGRAAFWLHHQVGGPRIDIVPSRYAPADRYGFEEVDCEPLDDRPGSPAACDIALIPPIEADEILLDAAALAPDRAEPITITAFPAHLRNAPPPALTVAITDTTGLYDLRYRFRQGDGEWTNWRIQPPLGGDPSARTIELIGASLETDRGQIPAEIQHVELRATDRASNTTTRALRWRRRVIAPPVSWRFDASNWMDADPATPSGYRFHAMYPYSEVFRLGFPENRDLGDGILIGRWLIHNPWPTAIRAEPAGRVTLRHVRSAAWRTDRTIAVVEGLDGRVRAPCARGQYYLGTAVWNERRSPCADQPSSIARGGVFENGGSIEVHHAFLHSAPDAIDGVLEVVADEGLILQPGATKALIIAADVVPLQLIDNGYEVALPSPTRLYRVERDRLVVTSTRPAERDAHIGWYADAVGVAVGTPLPSDPTTGYHPPLSVEVRVEQELLAAPDGFEWR